jgi:Sulfotransferase family
VPGPVTRKKHAKLADYASALNIGSYKVAISVRHPFNMAVSFFFSSHRGMRNRGDQWELEDPKWDRDEFISSLDKLVAMSSFLVVDGAIREPDFVVRYESIQADFRALTAAFGISPSDLPHVNRSAARDDLIRAALSDDDLRRIVSERYAMDMELFGYT